MGPAGLAGPSATFGVLESVAFALGLQDVTAMSQAVQRGADQALAPEYFRPILERQIGRDNQAIPLVGRGDHIEQEFRPSLAGGRRSQISIATGGRGFLEENLIGSSKAEALAGAVIE